jgi:hypothetical protein
LSRRSVYGSSHPGTILAYFPPLTYGAAFPIVRAMGKLDNRRSKKMRQRISQKKYKARLKRQKLASKAARPAAAKPAKKPRAAKE